MGNLGPLVNTSTAGKWIFDDIYSPQNGMIGFVDVFLIHSARSLFSHLPKAAETKRIQVAPMPCSHWTSEPASQLDVVHPTIQFMANDQNSTA